MPYDELVALWGRALADSADDQLPIAVAHQISPERHASPLTLYASAAAEIGAVVERFVDRWPVVTDAFGWSWHRDPEGGTLVADRGVPQEGERALLTFLTVEAVLSGRRITRGRWKPRDLALPWQVAPRWYRELGAEPWQTRDAARIGIRGEDLGIRPVAADPSMSRWLAAQLDSHVQVTGADALARVRREILQSLDQPEPTPPPDLATVAARLGRSARSLHRDLAAQGSSFRSLLERTRHELAESWLPHRSITDVSERLGYAEPRAFQRAFRRWTGVSPRAWLDQR